MKMWSAILLGSILAIPLTALSSTPSLAGGVCIDLGTGIRYELAGLPKSHRPKLFAGRNRSVEDIPLIASGYTKEDGTRIIGVTEMYSVLGVHPVGTAYIELPANSTSGTFWVTYSGRGAPSDLIGDANIVPCP